MRLKASLVVVVLLLSVGPADAQLIFSDDFEWGSICAWSNDRWYADFDDDGFGDHEDPGGFSGCPAPPLLVSNNLDCDDMAGEVHPGAAELCDGVDNDCDLASADGSEDPQYGGACDGLDSDLCEEGIFSCVAGSLSCSDASGSTTDVCDGADNDCDPASADGSEDPQYGAACDGFDSDLCVEGTFSCEAGSLTCSDNTSAQIDVCDGADNDCDPASADGSEDPLNGGACDGLDSDLCEEGIFSCVAGSLLCSDTTEDTVEVCDGLDNDCDGAADEDWSCSAIPDGCCPSSCGPGNDADCCEAQACSMTSDLCCPSSCSSADDADCV